MSDGFTHYLSTEATSFYVLAFLIPFTWLSYRLRWLTRPAALTAWLLAAAVLLLGHFSIVPLVVFFLSGTLLGKLPGRKLSDPKAQKTRDAWQVLANGGVTGMIAILAFFFPAAYWEPIYLATVAAACADTFSSEIGVRLSDKPFDALRFNHVTPGTSGGMSPGGLAGGLVGAACIAILEPGHQNFIPIILIGGAGTLIDSILGSLLQARYMNENGETTDYPGPLKVSGYAFFTNDSINLLTTLLSALLAWFILSK